MTRKHIETTVVDSEPDIWKTILTEWCIPKKKEKETAWCISCQDSWGKRFLKKKKKKKKSWVIFWVSI